MTEFGEPTRKDHQKYCLNEGWTRARNTRGKGGHHVTFLRDQLHVSEDEFWACVREKKRPQRGRVEPTTASIPAGVVTQLLAHGVEESEVRVMSRAEAIERLNLIWSQEA